MLNLKIAEAFVDLSVQMSQYRRDMAQVRKDLGNLPGSVVIDLSIRQTGLATIMRQIGILRASTATPIRLDFRVDRTRAVADLNMIMQQARAIRASSMGRIAIRADLRQWNRTMVQVFLDLNRVRTLANIPIRANTGAAHSSLNLLLQQLRAVQSAGRVAVTAPGAGRGARGGWGTAMAGGTSPAGSFLTGAAQGLGLGYAANPYMAAGQALTRLATAAAASSIALETQSAILRRVSGLSAGQTADVKGELFKVSTSPTNAASMSDLMDMATIGARMGVADKGGAKGLVEFTRGMSQLATVINDMDAGKLADEVGRSLNNFQLGTEYVQGFGSALMAMDNASIASAADLLNVTQRLSGQAKAAGLSIQETMALASVLKDVGISNEVAGTSFSQIFQKMASGSHKFAAALEIDSKTFEDAYRKGPLDALGLVIEKLAKMDDTVEKMQFLDELGLKGARTSGSLLRLTSVWDRLAGRIKAADAEFRTGKSLADGVAIQAATTESAGKRMSNAFRELGDAVMTKANPALAGMANILGDLAGGFAGVIKGQNDFWEQSVAKQKALAKPPEPEKPKQEVPANKVTTEQMQAEYMASNGEIVDAKFARQAARERLDAADKARDEAFNKAGIREGVAPAPWQKAAIAADERLAQAKLDAEKAGLKVEEAIQRHRDLGARLAQRERENDRALIKDRINNTIGELVGGREALRNALLRAGGRGMQAMDRAMGAGEKTREELFNMTDKERLEYEKKRQDDIAKNTGAGAAIASEMLATLGNIEKGITEATLGPDAIVILEQIRDRLAMNAGRLGP